MKNILKDWQACTKIKIFEFRVLDKRTNTPDWITFHIDIVDTKLRAQHEALTQAQIDSNKIACTSIDIDPDFSLDENLQELYSACSDAIYNSEFYIERGE